MAKDAKTEAEEVEEVKDLDFETALKCMLHDIRPIKEKKELAGSEESEGWKKIKDECHLASPAAKFFFTHILEREDETRDNNLRTLYGLLKTANIGISQDLVDKMSGSEAPTMPVVPAGQTSLHTVS